MKKINTANKIRLQALYGPTDFESRETLKNFFKCHPELESCHVTSDAKMRSGSEGQVRIRFSGYVEDLGIGKDRRITIG